MVRRKSKKKQQQETFNAMGLLVVMIGTGTLYFTKSIMAAGVIAIIALIVIVAIAYVIHEAKVARLRRSGIAQIDKMDGIQFEKYLEQLFRLQGYKANATRAQGDYGADLVISRNGEKIVVQAKRYSKNVGLKAVQEVHGAIAHYKASSGWVVTNSGYTQQARNLALSNNVRLIGRDELVEMILRVKK
ncbi:restriction endonuclease [Paenibacillus sp. WLX2291]|uniref:restriction endonuclease n=1 Tax=Paenibacillus sp. WLX2291 TaxID=3296934 RepID=UPI0039844C24